MGPRRRGALGGARQGRRERRYAGISARLRTPPRAAQRAPTTQSFIALEALRQSRSERLLERGAAVREDRLAVRASTSSIGRSSSDRSPAAEELRRVALEPGIRADGDPAAAVTHERVAGDERAVVGEPEHRLLDERERQRDDAARRAAAARAVPLLELVRAALRATAHVSRIDTGSPRRSTSRSSASKNRSALRPERAGRSGRSRPPPRSRRSRPPGPSRTPSFQSGCGAVQRQRPGASSDVVTRARVPALRARRTGPARRAR